MNNSIRDYASDSAKVNYDQLIKRFGTPKQIATAYINEMETEELVNELKTKRKIVGTVMVSAAVLLLLWAGLVAASYVSHVKDMNGYAVVEIIEIANTFVDEGGN